MVTSEKNLIVLNTWARADFHAVINRTYKENGNSPYFTTTVYFDWEHEVHLHSLTVQRTDQAEFHITVRPHGNRFSLRLHLCEKNANRRIKEGITTLIDSVEDFETAVTNFLSPLTWS